MFDYDEYGVDYRGTTFRSYYINNTDFFLKVMMEEPGPYKMEICIHVHKHVLERVKKG